MKKIIISLSILIAVWINIQNCRKEKSAWLNAVAQLMFEANQTLEQIIQRAEQAKEIDEYILILNDYSDAIMEIGQRYKKLAEKYPEVNANKPLIEKELSAVFNTIQSNIKKLAEIVQQWQKKYKTNKKLKEAIKNAARAAYLAEKETRPVEKYE